MARVIPSACQGCLSNCPVLVEVEDGRAVRVRGNAASGATGGSTCPALPIVLEQEYDPDRVLSPLRRRNPEKGRGIDPRFEPVTWDEALDEIADRMMALRRAGRPERFAFAKGRSTGINEVLMRVVPDIYGTSNRFNHDSICAEAEKLSTGVMDGCYDYHDYDWDRVECAIMWGADPLASNRQKAHARRALPAALKRAAVFVVDPRRSMTAEAAERAAKRAARSTSAAAAAGGDSPCTASGCSPASSGWVAVVPGTDGALASAIAHVILAEGLWNREYVGGFADGRNRFAESAESGDPVDPATFDERFTHGVCAWWNAGLRGKTPEWAAGECGVPAGRIVEVARAFASAGQHAISWVSPGVTMTARGLYTGMACYALNGLVGSVGAEGGVLSFPSLPVAKLPSAVPYQDDVARRGCASPRADLPEDASFLCARAGRAHVNPVTNAIPEAIESGRIDALLTYWCNFPFSCTETARWERALARLPFLVHVTTHVSEMSQFADIVLPARHHMFETWGFARCRQNRRSSVVLEQPCVEARGAARNDEAGLAFALAEKLADRGLPRLMEYFQAECTDPCTGRTPASGEELAEFAVKRATEPLWREAREPGAPVGAAGAWEAFRAKGVGETDPVSGRACGEEPGKLPTPTGKFEFESMTLRSLLEEHADRCECSLDDAAAALGYEARGAACFVPHYEPPVRKGRASEFPLVFSQHRSIVNLEGRSANSPLYQKLKRLDPGDDPWSDVVKIHPDDLRKLGIESGDEVRISSEVGSIVVRAKAWDGMRPGVVVKCYGQGHWAYGRVASLDFAHGVPRGGNNNDIVPAEWERASGATARHGGLVRVKIERA